MFTAAESASCRRLAALALEEDLGVAGGATGVPKDLTSLAVIPPDRRGQAAFVARSPGLVAGLPAAAIVFEGAADFQPLTPDGTAVQAGTRLAVVAGPMRAILAGERIALNFLQHLSGIATLTRRYVDAVGGLTARVLDTRKTTPGWRLLEKYAVRQGGGHNHRMGLYDGVLIKDNHLAAVGAGPSAVAEAVRRARAMHGTSIPLEIEVDDLEQLEVALRERPDIVLLDNMTPEQLREAVTRRNNGAPGVLLEASGGVTLDTVRTIAETGVDRISVGALTHSAPALDIGLDYLE
jgi:nicotinate-nucleotide pyrophosphorylase (carboxylating)